MEAGRDIDDVLRIQRRRLERTVAIGRVVGLGMATFMATVTQFHRGPDARVTWVPATIFGIGLVYAIALLVTVRRRDLGVGVALVAIVGDLLVVTAVYPVVQWTASGGADASDNLAWTAFLCGASVMLMVFINSLRASRATSAFVALAGPAAFLASTSLTKEVHWWSEPWAPAVISVSVMIFVTGCLSYFAAAEHRRFLERYARYELLKRWLPAEAVRRVLVDDRPMTLGGRKLPLTLVATDLRGFTALSEGLAPEQLLEQLNEYHGAMLECVDRHDGMLDKFIGDGALAVFGIRGEESAIGDSGAEAAVRCARDMLGALATLNEARLSRGLAALGMGIGIHTGEVVLGNIGAPGRRLELTVIGDAVNTASRLESATKELGVPLVVSDSTRKLLPAHVASAFRTLGDVSVRGRKEAITVCTFPELGATARPLEV